MVSQTAGRGPVQRQRGDRRTEIVRRAAKIFGRQGFASTSLEDIATASGVRREAPYYYFRDKTEILYDIIRRPSDGILRGMERLRASGVPSKEQLAAAIGNHLESFNSGFIEITVIARELKDRNAMPRLAAIHKIWESSERHWVDLIRFGRAEGAFDAKQDPKVAPFWACATGYRIVYRPGGSISLSDLTRDYTSLALGGLVSSRVHLKRQEKSK